MREISKVLAIDRTTLALAVMAGLLVPKLACAQTGEKAQADVVVIVDNSVSIKQEGFDPERTSLLVARLFSDIVPGGLAVIRTLDLARDSGILPSHPTGRKRKCEDGRECNEVEATTDWVQAVRSQPEKAGLMARPARGDAGYKELLEQHLRQEMNNSLFGLSFETADAYFRRAGAPAGPRVLIWLSDGEPDDLPRMQAATEKLSSNGVLTRAIIFGKGRVDYASQLGLQPKVVHNPGELMSAFADIFREIVDAPYRLDGVVSQTPEFEMKPSVEEAWVVVYGDETLGDVSFDTPQGTRRADYAADRFHQPGVARSAGGYKVLYAESPASGTWRIHATGGGQGVAFAVIQRSSLFPVLIEPSTASTGVPVRAVGAIARSKGGTPLASGGLPPNGTLTFEFEDQKIVLKDGGDGKYSANVTFRHAGVIPVTVRLKSDLMDRTASGEVQVSSLFRYKGGPISLQFGEWNAGASSCRTLLLQAEQDGEAILKVEETRRLPHGHRWELRRGGSSPRSGSSVPFLVGDPLELCLLTDAGAYSSVAKGEDWVALRAGSTIVPIRPSWKVNGLSWLARNLKYIVAGLILLLILLWIYGFIWPRDFPGRLAVQYAEEQDELDEQMSLPLSSIRSIRKRWYRNAHGYFHANYSINRKPGGALLSFNLTDRGVTIRTESGNALYRLDSEGQWVAIPPEGRRAGMGETYRINDRGPYLRLEQKGGKRK
jgi:hypothetical protein